MTRLRSQVGTFGANLRRPLRNSHSQWTSRRGLHFRIFTSDGFEGLGEASPLPNYSPDSFKDCENFLKTKELFCEKDLNLNTIKQLIATVPNGLPAARFAVETALLDILGQRRGQSLSSLLGSPPTPIPRCGLLDPDDAITSASALLQRHVRCAKLKVGKQWDAELPVIRAICQQFPELTLRLDVNGGWSLGDARRHLATLAPLPIEFVEQPVCPAQMGLLHDSPVPLAADESMRCAASIRALSPLIEQKVLVAVIVKPSILGGLLACLEHVDWATQHHIASIPSHCFEGPVATAALAELAVARPCRYAVGIDSHHALLALSLAAIPQLGAPHITTHGPGLGFRYPV